MPLLVSVITLAMVLFGAGYILMSESFGRADLGDRRTIADLSGPAVKTGQAVDGKQLFNANCVACHQANGKGLPGLFPPLDGSEWVNGDPRVLANIMLLRRQRRNERHGPDLQGRHARLRPAR